MNNLAVFFKGMSKPSFHLLVGIVALFACLLVSFPAQADIVFSLLQVGANNASDENREYLIDRVTVLADGTMITDKTDPRFVKGQMDVGDSLRGSVNITTMNSSSANVGGLTGNDELTGVFQVKITSLIPVGPLYLITFGPDPAFEADLGGGMTSSPVGFVPGPGAIAVLFDDSSNDYAGDFNDPPPSVPPAGPDDGTPGMTVPPSSADVSVGPYDTEEAFIATAANGTWFATLGFKGVSGEGGSGMTNVAGANNILTSFSITSGSTFANSNLGLSLLALGPAAAGLTINKSTPSAFGGTIDFAVSQQYRGVHDLSTPFEVSSNTNISFVASFESAGSCRMTGGSETLITDVVYGPTYVWTPGTYVSDPVGNQVLVTTGGQIGAPLASPTGPSFGEWTHQQHCNTKNGKCTGNNFGFDFKAGTASDKGTIINSVVCGDKGWCTQARCAPFKQIFWDGIGDIKNISGTFVPLNACTNIGEGSFHYFKAHVGDFGEPGSSVVKKKNPPTCSTPCTWTSGGVDIANIVNLTPVSPAPEPFASKGGEICPCGCGDWYEIEIHCTTETNSPIIYRFASFINTGNFQLHPPVGESCN